MIACKIIITCYQVWKNILPNQMAENLFSKLDLSDAYLQIPVEECLKLLLTLIKGS